MVGHLTASEQLLISDLHMKHIVGRHLYQCSDVITHAIYTGRCPIRASSPTYSSNTPSNIYA